MGIKKTSATVFLVIILTISFSYYDVEAESGMLFLCEDVYFFLLFSTIFDHYQNNNSGNKKFLKI